MPIDNPSPRPRFSLSWLHRFGRRGNVVTMSDASDRELVLSLSPKRIPSWRQLKFLPRLLSRLEQRWLRLFAVIAGLSLLTLLGNQLARHVRLVPAEGGSITEGLVGTPQYINPVLARPFTSDTDVTKLLFRGLVTFDDELQPQPDLAESVTVSSDGKTYTAVLRRNLHWSDGSAVTVDDVVYTYEIVANASYQSPVQAAYANVSVASPDEHTITFTLPAPAPSFMAALSLGILPAQLWQDQTPQTFPLAELNVKPVGNGPYKFQSVTKDRTGNIRAYTFVRNKFYDGPRPRLDKLNVKLYADVASAIDALRSDAIDTLGGIDHADLNQAKKGHVLTHVLISQITGVFFNTKSNAALKSLDVRKALAMVVDREKLVNDELQGIGAPLYGPLLPGVPGFSAEAKQNTGTAEQATALLDQAGWKVTNGVRVKDKQTLAFTLTTVDDVAYTAIAQQLVASWNALGAKVTLNVVPADVVQKNVIKDRRYDAFLFGQLIDAGGDIYPLWHSSQQQSPGIALAINFNKSMDTDLEKARSATTHEARAAALRDFHNLVIDNVPAVLIAQNDYVYAHPKRLRGLLTNNIISAEYHWQDITNWYVKSRWGWK